jgi:uncharacterized protein (DUF58 family)
MPINIDQNRIQPLTRLEFFARQVVEGFITGLHKSPYHGFSVEFAEHRLYNPGESTRNIDWKLFGRTDKLFVKRYEEETNLRCQLVIDNSASMHFPKRNKLSIDSPDKMLFSVYAAAVLTYLFKKQRDAVGLTVFSDKTDVSTPARSNAVHLQHLFSQLQNLADNQLPKENQTTSAAESIHYIAETIHKRSLVIIFSDMFDTSANADDLFNALQHLRHNKHEVILFHTIDKSLELDFGFENRPYRFIDVETGEEIKVNAAEIREHYLKGMHEFVAELKLKCGQYHIDFVEADINGGFEQILLPYLVKRGKLY